MRLVAAKASLSLPAVGLRPRRIVPDSLKGVLMYFASALVLALSASFHGATSTPDGTFASYTQAYRTAADVKRPMLVILNPAPKEGETQETISIADLRADAGISDLLANYVV